MRKILYYIIVILLFTSLSMAGKKPQNKYSSLLNKSISLINNELNSSSFYTLISAIQASGESKDSIFLPRLLPKLNDPKNEIRLEAAKSAFALGDLSGVKVVEEIVKTPIKLDGDANNPLIKMKFLAQENIRINAATALGDIGGAATMDLLKQIKKEESGRMNDALSVAIAKLGDTTENVLFERALKDKDPFVRLSGIKALAEIANRKTLPSIIAVLNDSSPEVRAEACRAIGNIGSGEALNDLTKMLGDPVDTVRGAAIESLGKLEDRSSLNVLKKLLEDTNGSIRLIAARSLGLLGSNDGLAAVEESMENKDTDVKMRVIASLDAINNEKSIEYLTKLLDDQDEKLRLKSAAVLIKKINRIK